MGSGTSKNSSNSSKHPPEPSPLIPPTETSTSTSKRSSPTRLTFIQPSPPPNETIPLKTTPPNLPKITIKLACGHFIQIKMSPSRFTAYNNQAPQTRAPLPPEFQIARSGARCTRGGCGGEGWEGLAWEPGWELVSGFYVPSVGEVERFEGFGRQREGVVGGVREGLLRGRRESVVPWEFPGVGDE